MHLTPVVMRGIGDENGGAHARAVVGETAVKRNMEDKAKVQLHCVGLGRIAEAIESFTRGYLQIAENTDDPVHGPFVNYPARAPDKEARLFYELNIRREFHF